MQQPCMQNWVEMVFCFKNCSDLLWEKNGFDREIILKIRDLRLRTCKHFEITRTIFWSSERPEQSMKQNNFLLVTGGFYKYNTYIGKNNLDVESYRNKLENIIK